MVGLIQRTMPSRTAVMIEIDRAPAAELDAVKHNLDYMTKRSASSSGKGLQATAARPPRDRGTPDVRACAPC